MNNPLMQEIMRMRMQGMTPMQARQQLAQRYPQLSQAQPFMQGQTPQEIDAIAKNAAQSMGLNPMQMMAQIQGFMHGRR